jgi:hypothetical protein
VEGVAVIDGVGASGMMLEYPGFAQPKYGVVKAHRKFTRSPGQLLPPFSEL